MKKPIIAFCMIGIFALLFMSLMGSNSTVNVTAGPSEIRLPSWYNPDTNPVVSITSPSNGETVEGVVLVTVSASDDKGVVSVFLEIDGVAYDIIVGLSYNWDTNGLVDGDYVLVAIATDTIGQIASDSITVSIGEVTPPPPPPPPTGNKFAVIVGISDYKTISDLSFCDEDATDWYNFLTA